MQEKHQKHHSGLFPVICFALACIYISAASGCGKVEEVPVAMPTLEIIFTPTPEPTATFTPTPEPTLPPDVTPTNTPTPTATFTPTPAPTRHVGISDGAVVTATPTPTPTPVPVADSYNEFDKLCREMCTINGPFLAYDYGNTEDGKYYIYQVKHAATQDTEAYTAQFYVDVTCKDLSVNYPDKRFVTAKDLAKELRSMNYPAEHSIYYYDDVEDLGISCAWIEAVDGGTIFLGEVEQRDLHVRIYANDDSGREREEVLNRAASVTNWVFFALKYNWTTDLFLEGDTTMSSSEAKLLVGD